MTHAESQHVKELREFAEEFRGLIDEINEDMPKRGKVADGWYRALAAVLAGAEALERDQWQPIETAPKDGTTVILGRFMEGWGFVRGLGYWATIPDMPHCDGWVPTSAFSNPPGVLGLGYPTHWRPGPEPPKVTG